MDNLDSDDSLRRGIEHHQFYGWDKWHHRSLRIGLFAAAVPSEQGNWLRGRIPHSRRCTCRPRLLLLQLPPEGEGQVLRRRCGLNRSSIYPALPHRLPDSRDGRCDISHLPAGLWRGRMPYHMPSHPAAREPGRGAPQACVPADGQ